MGGMGSGRWGWHTRASTVEASLVIDIGMLGRKKWLRPGYGGTLSWTCGGRPSGHIGYEVRAHAAGLVLTLAYKWTPWGQDKAEEIREDMLLQAEPMRFGGVRWWGRCPLGTDGRTCGRRVAKLYKPPGARYFGCRQGYRLTYTSCQESHRYDGLERMLAGQMGWNVEEVREAMRQMRTGKG